MKHLKTFEQIGTIKFGKGKKLVHYCIPSYGPVTTLCGYRSQTDDAPALNDFKSINDITCKHCKDVLIDIGKVLKR